ncbi:hypothetical protein DXG01_002679 [Tephrocybe rancida]|nr:hypothetical protein DXG01_002679 [Tephrocybe rancida]
MQTIPFVDPKVEGTIWTADTRVGADVYIQEQIKVHESIIHYYKNRRNALTSVCQLPPEILGSIFGEVVKLAEEVNFDGPWNHRHKVPWVRSISHVCSHWRKVALFTPSLWSDIPLDFPGCVHEMVRRSRTMPLTVAYLPSSKRYATDTRDLSKSHVAFKEILSSYLPRIGSLTVNTLWRNAHGNSNSIQIAEIFALLDRPAPMMEQLELRVEDISGKHKLPDAMTRGFTRLEHLTLEGCGMGWEPSAFRDLKTLVISHIPPSMKLSMTQLLGILSQTPLLEKLSLVDIDQMADSKHTLPPPNAAPISLVHLEDVQASMSLLSTVFLFDHLIFSRNARAFNVRVNVSGPVDKPFVLTVQRLVQRIEKCVEGSIIQLQLSSAIEFWKLKSSQKPPYPGFLVGQSAISINFSDPAALAGKLGHDFWQSFGLDKLVSFDLENARFSTKTLWPFLGNLPHLQNLRVHHEEGPLLEALSYCPSFVALQSLTIEGWDFEWMEAASMECLVFRLGDCFQLRREAGLELEVLKVMTCVAVHVDYLADLEAHIKLIEWDGNGYDKDMDARRALAQVRPDLSIKLGVW